MVNFTVEQVRAIMDKKHNIRNATVIAHVDHGKSTLTDSLVRLAGISTQERFTDGVRDDQLQRGITIKSTGLSLHFEMEPEDVPASADGNEFLFNIIDSPGHVDFSSEVTAALRLTDGALVVVDCVEGVCVQTGTVLRQALSERVKPVLIVNKLDRAILELQHEPEETYNTLCRVIESVNVIISTYEDDKLGDCQVRPEDGTVAFGSGLHGWGFTIPTFAKMLAKKFGNDPKKLQTRLWGDNFWDPESKKWYNTDTSPTGKKLQRGFCQFVLSPIYKLMRAMINNKKEVVAKMLADLEIQLKGEERDLSGKELMKCVMPKFLPLGRTLLRMMAVHLPSPATAQQYRVENLYTGPLDDECATAIRNCDPNGPLMIYISKMVPGNKGRFYAYGRVFSGVARSGKVRIMGPDFEPGTSKDLYVKNIQRVCLAMGRFIENLDDAPCGNLVCLVGIDQYLVKTGTITTSETACCFRTMKFSVSPVVRMAVKPKRASDITDLVKGLKQVAKTDPCVQVEIDEATGEMIVAGAGELHLEIIMKDLADLSGIEIVQSEPVVSYKETVLAASEKPALAKSPNKHNRLWISAEPMAEGLAEAIESGEIDNKGDSSKDRGKILVDKFGWDLADTRKIWDFGPNSVGPNVVVDMTRGVQYLNEIKDSVVSAFSWASREGVLCGEGTRGIRYNIMDVQLHADAVHRGGGQIIPTARRVFQGAQLTSKPALMEPVYLVDIQTNDAAMSGIYGALSRRRGHVFATEQGLGNTVTMKAYLPVSESFGFTESLREATGGNAFPQAVFDHWQLVPGDVLTDGMAKDVVLKVRARRGMKNEIPRAEDYIDKL